MSLRVGMVSINISPGPRTHGQLYNVQSSKTIFGGVGLNSRTLTVVKNNVSSLIYVLLNTELTV